MNFQRENGCLGCGLLRKNFKLRVFLVNADLRSLQGISKYIDKSILPIYHN